MIWHKATHHHGQEPAEPTASQRHIPPPVFITLPTNLLFRLLAPDGIPDKRTFVLVSLLLCQAQPKGQNSETAIATKYDFAASSKVHVLVHVL